MNMIAIIIILGVLIAIWTIWLIICFVILLLNKNYEEAICMFFMALLSTGLTSISYALYENQLIIDEWEAEVSEDVKKDEEETLELKDLKDTTMTSTIGGSSNNGFLVIADSVYIPVKKEIEVTYTKNTSSNEIQNYFIKEPKSPSNYPTIEPYTTSTGVAPNIVKYTDSEGHKKTITKDQLIKELIEENYKSK